MKRNAILFIFLFLTFELYAQLVLPGDYPDPSVVKIEDTYWASATTSNWAPAYPLLSSKDLIHWEQQGVVFPQLPSWADYYFWAPEISYDQGKVFVYYAAHQKGGNLCVAVASADQPQGPYTDHGPLMCEPDGSIDAFPIRDENGKLYLIWKEDGNSIKQPTPIWAMAMDEDRKKLTGEKKELFRNTEPWEGNLVEGVSIIRHGAYFYAFYAGAGCCGRSCNYATGVARSKNLLGPWEKYMKNPVLADDHEWKCPGHGTPVEKDGKFYFLYHAYNKKSNVFTGRQGLLKEFKFTDDGWIEFVKDAPGEVQAPERIKDDFDSEKRLAREWQWPVSDEKPFTISSGVLRLEAGPLVTGNFIGHKTFSNQYDATALLLVNNSTAEGGIAVIGDEKNMIGFSYFNKKLKAFTIDNGKETYLPEINLSAKEKVALKVEVKVGAQIRFLYSVDGGKFEKVSGHLEGTFLPPWDRAVRVGLFSKGQKGEATQFEDFIMNNQQ